MKEERKQRDIRVFDGKEKGIRKVEDAELKGGEEGNVQKKRKTSKREKIT